MSYINWIIEYVFYFSLFFFHSAQHFCVAHDISDSLVSTAKFPFTLLSVHLLVDICASSTFWLLKIILPWTFINHFSWNEISFIHIWEFKAHKLNYLHTLQSYNGSANSLNLEISQLSVSGRILPVEFMIKLCNIASSQSEIWNMKSPKKKVELKWSHKNT